MNNDFKEIFEKNYAALCNYANAIVKDKHIAQDLVQLVFVQLWQSNKIDQLKDPTPYLLKSVKYKCLDHIKSNYKKHEFSSDSIPDRSIESVKPIKEEDILPLLHYFASMLPKKMQQVFLMSRQQGMTYKEISQELNISPKTVENQMGSALKKLKILLQEHNYLPALLLFLQ